MYPAHVYGYQFDYSEQRIPLLDVVAGADPDINLVNVLRIVTGDDWRLSGESDYSLDGATISYAGDNQPYMLSNSNYTNLITIELSESCLALEGTLILQFNVPKA